jgi:FkbH-like protein
VHNRPPRKGLITDLDNTLWGGVLGDDGVQNITWDLDHHTQSHALYQQLLGSLSEAGVLVAIASKNDAKLVDEALTRQDLLLSTQHVFPIDVSWGSKAEAVARVLKAWNVHADSVLFVDDSATELAEVQAAHPAIACLQFPSEPAAVQEFLRRVRDEFGRDRITDEDALRTESVRRQHAVVDAITDSDGYSERLLETSEAQIALVFSRDVGDARALELVNKTNQFNLNGRRYTARTWAEYLSDPKAFLMTATYTDRFGALGKIAVLAGRADHDALQVDVWVMSCRAFARRIEHQCLKALFDRWRIPVVRLAYAETDRNGPFQRFLGGVLKPAPGGALVTLADFEAACPRLYHTVVVTDGVEDERCAHTSG